MYKHICFDQPKQIRERMEIALDYIQQTEYSLPLVLDNMDNSCAKAYAAWPERLYVLEQGRVAYKGDMGPDGYKPEELEQWLNNRFNA
jgi:type I thyroxine 5'-deiodinase